MKRQLASAFFLFPLVLFAQNGRESVTIDTKTHRVQNAILDFTNVTLIGIPSVPTGTGFVHVTSGAEDSTAKLVLDADVASNAAIAQSKLNLNGNIPAGWLGTSSTTAAAGNDSRLSDQRTPADSSVTDAKVANNAAIAESKLNLATDAAANVGSRRTLGTGAQQAAAGNDPRLSDQRTPTDGSVTTAKLADKAVTYAKIQDVTNSKLLGRWSAGAGNAQEIGIGSGLAVDGLGNLYTTSGGGNVNGSGLTSGDVITGAGTSNVQDSGVAIAQLENNYQAVTVSAAGSTNSNIASQNHAMRITANAGSGAYTATIAIPTTGRVAGDKESVHVDYAASTNPTVEVHNATSGGTLLFTWTGDGTATQVLVECRYDGSAWYLHDAHFIY
jgi:hypothetical protein